MVTTNNDLTLTEKPEKEMSGRVPEYVTFDELLEKFPTITERCWTKKDFVIWIDQQLIGGRGLGRGQTLEIHVPSFEKFLSYHDDFLRTRSEDALRGIDEYKARRGSKRRRSRE